MTADQLAESLALHAAWRRGEPHGVRFVAIGADLSGANLSGADLRGADLIGANLRGADLTGADLSHAVVTGADLRTSVGLL